MRSKDGPEQFYQRTLAASGYLGPAAEVIQTLTYFRYRRNAAVHLSTTPPPLYASLARKSGQGLNTFWARAKLQIDFRHASTGLMSEHDALDALKLLRIIIQRLDEHLSGVLEGRGAARLVARRLFGDKKVRLNLQVIEERARKLRAVLFRDYGVTVSQPDLTVAIRAANQQN